MFSFLGVSQPETGDEPVTTAVDTAEVSTTTNMQEESERITGQVKFFNDQTMYGFITRLDNGSDVFVHIRDLQPKVCPSPTLFTGEYVTFSLASNGTDADGNERQKAVEVRGINSGSLMCDHGEIIFKSYSRLNFQGQN